MKPHGRTTKLLQSEGSQGLRAQHPESQCFLTFRIMFSVLSTHSHIPNSCRDLRNF